MSDDDWYYGRKSNKHAHVFSAVASATAVAWIIIIVYLIARG